MKIKHLPWILSAAAILLFSSYALMYPSGAPAGYTGSPGDGKNCSGCHTGGTASTVAGLITSNIPSGGYIAGQTYQITATNNLAGSGNYGFEVSPQNAAGTQLGTLVAGTGSKLLAGGSKYVTQSNSNTTKSWTFGWIAPAAGTGQVTFYGAMARSTQSNTALSSLVVQEAINTALPKETPASVSVIAGESKGFINVGLNTNAYNAKVSVFDLSGRQLLSTTLSGSGSHQLNQQFKTGVYIVVVQAEDTVLKKKIFVL